MKKYSLVVWSEPSPGKEDVFNDWYSNKHLGDVLEVPGFTAAQRYVFAGETATPRKYLAIYDVEADNPEAVMAMLSTNPEVGKVDPALDLNSIIVSVVERI